MNKTLLISLGFLLIFKTSCQMSKESTLSQADPKCLETAIEVSILETEQKLLDSMQEAGLTQDQGALVVAKFIHENRDNYTSVFGRVAFNMSEAGCLDVTDDVIEKVSLQGLLNNTSVKVFGDSELKEVFGITDPNVTAYVQVSLTSFYWDYGIYWFLLGNEVGTDSEIAILEFGVDD